MATRMQKKTRNIISGIMVGLASVFAVINYADIPADDVLGFVLSTLALFVGIVLLALLVVSLFKLVITLKRRLTGQTDNPADYELPADYYAPRDASPDASLEKDSE